MDNVVSNILDVSSSLDILACILENVLCTLLYLRILTKNMMTMCLWVMNHVGLSGFT